MPTTKTTHRSRHGRSVTSSTTEFDGLYSQVTGKLEQDPNAGDDRSKLKDGPVKEALEALEGKAGDAHSASRHSYSARGKHGGRISDSFVDYQSAGMNGAEAAWYSGASAYQGLSKLNPDLVSGLMATPEGNAAFHANPGALLQVAQGMGKSAPAELTQDQKDFLTLSSKDRGVLGALAAGGVATPEAVKDLYNHMPKRLEGEDRINFSRYGQQTQRHLPGFFDEAGQAIPQDPNAGHSRDALRDGPVKDALAALENNTVTVNKHIETTNEGTKYSGGRRGKPGRSYAFKDTHTEKEAVELNGAERVWHEHASTIQELSGLPKAHVGSLLQTDPGKAALVENPGALLDLANGQLGGVMDRALGAASRLFGGDKPAAQMGADERDFLKLDGQGREALSSLAKGGLSKDDIQGLSRAMQGNGTSTTGAGKGGQEAPRTR